MNVKRTAGFVVAGGVIAALIAGATPSPRRAADVAAAPQPARVDLQGAALSAEIERLRERLRPSTEPRLERNPFAFVARPSATRVPVSSAPPPEPAPAPPAVPMRDVALVGIAEDARPDGVVRTAILSVDGELLLVAAGGEATPRYRVLAVEPDHVALSDRADGQTIRLSLH